MGGRIKRGRRPQLTAGWFAKTWDNKRAHTPSFEEDMGVPLIISSLLKFRDFPARL